MFLRALRVLVWLKKIKNKKFKTGGAGGVPPPRRFRFHISFLYSVKSIISLEVEKDRVVGFEPGTKFLPTARVKSGINLVHDTAYLQG